MKRRTSRQFAFTTRFEGLEHRALLTTLVAEIDTGVDESSTSADLNYYALSTGYNAYTLQSVAQTNNPNIVQDGTINGGYGPGHGSAVADVIVRAIQDAASISGVSNAASNVKIMPIVAQDGYDNIAPSAVIEGIYYAADHGASIINLSLAGNGGFSDSNPNGSHYGSTITDAINYAASKNVVVVTAAGNGEDGNGPGEDIEADPWFKPYPAWVHTANMIVTAAIDKTTGKLGSLSNWGAVHVDLGAPTPGVEIKTSFSTAYTTGIAGVVAALSGNSSTGNPVSATQIVQDITNTVTPYTQTVATKWCTTNGNINPAAAFAAVAPSAPSVPANLTAVAYSSKAVSVSWSPVAGATSYTLQRSTSASFSSPVNVSLTSPTSTSALDIGRNATTTYYYRVNATVGGQTSAFSTASQATTTNRAVGDFDGDGKTDLAVFSSSTGTIKYRPSGGGADVTVSNFTIPAGDTPVVADYDGDGRADVGYVYSDANNTYFVWKQSSDGTTQTRTFGPSGCSPLVGDFDGDGKDDLAIFKSSGGTDYFNYFSSAGNTVISFTYPDSPVLTPIVADFDGDGRSDLGLFWTDSQGGHLKYHPSSAGADESHDVTSGAFGASDGAPLVGDFDGDGKADLAVYVVRNGQYYINYFSTKNNKPVGFNWGNASYQIATGDFDGDGVTDVLQYDQSGANAYEMKSSQNADFFANNANLGNNETPAIAPPISFGLTNDTPQLLVSAPRKRS